MHWSFDPSRSPEFYAWHPLMGIDRSRRDAAHLPYIKHKNGIDPSLLADPAPS